MSIEVVATIKEHFGEVRDSRQPGKVEHPLINIIFLTICGIFCGADNYSYPQCQDHKETKISDINTG